jgi:cytochrome c-type protein NapC
MPKELEGKELPAASNDAIGDLRKAVASVHGAEVF